MLLLPCTILLRLQDISFSTPFNPVIFLEESNIVSASLTKEEIHYLLLIASTVEGISSVKVLLFKVTLASNFQFR